MAAVGSKSGSDSEYDGESENASQYSEEEYSPAPPVVIPPRHPRGTANLMSRLFFW